MNLPAHIFFDYRPLGEIPQAEAEAMLSAGEREVLNTLRLEKRRKEFVAGRFVARKLASKILDVDGDQAPLVVCDDGSLALEGTDYGISLAHTRTGVCAGMALNTPIGVDIERIEPRNEDLFRFILHESEYNLLETLPADRTRILILCWVLKESVLKGMRTGFRCSPKKLRLSIALAHGTAEIHAPGDVLWKAHFEERDGCYMAVAFPGSVDWLTGWK